MDRISASERPSLSTSVLEQHERHSVLRAACATVANCAGVLNPSAAMAMFVPRLSTGFNRSCSAGVDGGIAAALGATLVAPARAAAARGAPPGVAAGGSCSIRRVRPPHAESVTDRFNAQRHGADEAGGKKCCFAYRHC